MYRLSRQRMWCLHIVSTCQQAGGPYLAQVMRYIPTVCSHSGCACNAVMVFCTHECMYIWYMMTFSHTLQISLEPYRNYVVHHNTNTPFTSKKILLCLPSQSTAQFVLLQSAGIRDWFTHTAGQLRKGIDFINTYVKRRTNSQKITLFLGTHPTIHYYIVF